MSATLSQCVTALEDQRHLERQKEYNLLLKGVIRGCLELLEDFSQPRVSPKNSTPPTNTTSFKG